jgi:hypothetical protein
LKIPVSTKQASCGRGTYDSLVRPQDACFSQTGVFNTRSCPQDACILQTGIFNPWPCISQQALKTRGQMCPVVKEISISP